MSEDGRDMGQEVAAPRSQQIFCERDGEQVKHPDQKQSGNLSGILLQTSVRVGVSRLCPARMTGMQMSGSSRGSGALPQHLCVCGREQHPPGCWIPLAGVSLQQRVGSRACGSPSCTAPEGVRRVKHLGAGAHPGRCHLCHPSEERETGTPLDGAPSPPRTLPEPSDPQALSPGLCTQEDVQLPLAGIPICGLDRGGTTMP